MRETATLERPWFARWPADLPRSLTYPDVPVQDLLRRTAGEHGDRPAVTFYGKTLTYRDLDAAVNRFAAGLRSIGVRAGDRVSLLLPNTPHFIVAFFAVLRTGAIVVQTNPILTPRELEVLWNDAGVETVVALDLFWHNVSKAKPGPRSRESSSATPRSFSRRRCDSCIRSRGRRTSRRPATGLSRFRRNRGSIGSRTSRRRLPIRCRLRRIRTMWRSCSIPAGRPGHRRARCSPMGISSRTPPSARRGS